MTLENNGNLDDGIDLNNESEIIIDYEQLFNNSRKEIEELQNKIKLLESQQKKESPIIKTNKKVIKVK